MKFWTYRHRFTLDGRQALVVLGANAASLDASLALDGTVVARDVATMKPHRNAVLHHLLPDGRRLSIETGYNSWTGTGMVARVDGTIVHESHPGRPVALPEGARKMMGEIAMSEEQMKTNQPSIVVDFALGLLFFLVARATDLTTAALVAAGVSVVLLVVQRFVKIDLLGGLAIFGVVMSLISAGLALVFNDDGMVQLRSTIMGLLGAALFLADAATGGRYLAVRMKRYVPTPSLTPARLSLAMGISGLAMALANLLVMRTFSKDQWLIYTTFLDLPVAIGALFGSVWLVRQRQTAR